MLKKTFTLKITVSFDEYSNKNKNRKAIAQIKKCIKESLVDNLSYIPFYVEVDEFGSLIEGVSNKSKIKVY